jgi:hypothetical protein
MAVCVVLAGYWVLLCGIAGSALLAGWCELGRIVAEIERWEQDREVDVGRQAHWVRQQQAEARGGSAFEQARQKASISDQARLLSNDMRGNFFNDHDRSIWLMLMT